MQFFNNNIITMLLVTWTTLITLSTIITASTLPASFSSISNTTTAPLQWIGLIKGKEITLYGENGSDIMAQRKILDPDWVPTTSRNKTENSIATRGGEGTRYCCPVAGWNWQACSYSDWFQAQDNLYALGGEWVIQPNMCREVAPSGHCMIWACNTDRVTAYRIKGKTIVHYGDVIRACDGGDAGPVCGQLFTTGQNWNIVIHTYTA